MPNRDIEADDPQESESRPLQRHLLGTMFDTTRIVERELSTGTVVRLRIEELAQGTVAVHEAWRRRGDGNWNRWRDIEGEQSAQEIRLDLCREVGTRPD